jgi:hypothetical protein
MARIIVTTNSVRQRGGPELLDEIPVLLDERVDSIHLGTVHGAKQLIERLTWAVTDAERAERLPTEPGDSLRYERVDDSG